MARALIPALLLCLLIVVSCAPQNEIAEPDAVVSASSEINESWGWVVKAASANQELWNLVKQGSPTEAKLQMNAMPVYLDEADLLVEKAQKSTIPSEKCSIAAIQGYTRYIRTAIDMNENMLNVLAEMAKLEVTTDLGEVGITISEARKQADGAKSELAKAKSQINSIDLNCTSSEMRVFIGVDKNQVRSVEKALDDLGAYLDATKVFVDSGQRFAKVVPALESNKVDEAIVHIKGAIQLNNEAKQKFSSLTSSEFLEIATTSVALKERIGIVGGAYLKFEEGLVALKQGNEQTAVALFEEANAMLQGMQ
jgi:hypothetical protein